MPKKQHTEAEIISALKQYETVRFLRFSAKVPPSSHNGGGIVLIPGATYRCTVEAEFVLTRTPQRRYFSFTALIRISTAAWKSGAKSMSPESCPEVESQTREFMPHGSKSNRNH